MLKPAWAVVSPRPCFVNARRLGKRGLGGQFCLIDACIVSCEITKEPIGHIPTPYTMKEERSMLLLKRVHCDKTKQPNTDI